MTRINKICCQVCKKELTYKGSYYDTGVVYVGPFTGCECEESK